MKIFEIIVKSIMGLGCFLFMLVGMYGWYWASQINRGKRRVLQEGDYVQAWVVQANVGLFATGDQDLPAGVIYSFDPRVTQTNGCLESIANAVAELKRRREPANEDEAKVAKIVQNEFYAVDNRDQLPLGFTNGMLVYSASVKIERRYLPEGKLSLPYIYCWAHPEEKVTCMAPYPQRAS